jgi:hypothetical protein
MRSCYSLSLRSRVRTESGRAGRSTAGWRWLTYTRPYRRYNVVVADSVEQLSYELTTAALAEQEGALPGLRTRSGTVLAAASIAGSFLGAKTSHGGLDVWAILIAGPLYGKEGILTAECDLRRGLQPSESPTLSVTMAARTCSLARGR